MTPNTLYTLLDMGLFAAVVSLEIAVGLVLLPSIWRGAKRGHIGAPLSVVIVAWGTLKMYQGYAEAHIPGPSWVDNPIVCDDIGCGWAYYFVLMVGAARPLTIAVMGIGFVGGVALIRAAWVKIVLLRHRVLDSEEMPPETAAATMRVAAGEAAEHE